MGTNMPSSQYNFSHPPWMPVLCFGRTPLKRKRSLHFIFRIQQENNTCCPEQQSQSQVNVGCRGREGWFSPGSPPLGGCPCSGGQPHTHAHTLHQCMYHSLLLGLVGFFFKKKKAHKVGKRHDGGSYTKSRRGEVEVDKIKTHCIHITNSQNIKNYYLKEKGKKRVGDTCFFFYLHTSRSICVYI